MPSAAALLERESPFQRARDLLQELRGTTANASVEPLRLSPGVAAKVARAMVAAELEADEPIPLWKAKGQPRIPAGSSKGGQFAPKGGSGGYTTGMGGKILPVPNKSKLPAKGPGQPSQFAKPHPASGPSLGTAKPEAKVVTQAYDQSAGKVAPKQIKPKTTPHDDNHNPEDIAVFAPDEPPGAGLNGIAFASWHGPEGGDFSTIPDKFQEAGGPPHALDAQGKPKRVGAGVIVTEPDGRVWTVEPTQHFGGYKQSFPKGGQEEGLSLQQTAIKEAWEESGLKVEIHGVLGDYEGDTSIARYYLARRIGGSPADAGWETQGVRLVPPAELHNQLNRARDKQIATDLVARLKKEPIEKAKGGGGKSWITQARAPAGTSIGGQWIPGGYGSGGLGKMLAQAGDKLELIKAKGANEQNSNLVATNKAIQAYQDAANQGPDAWAKHANNPPTISEKPNPYQKAKYAAWVEADAYVKEKQLAGAAKTAGGTDGPLKLSEMTWVKEKPGGSAQGAIYQDKAGNRWLVKSYPATSKGMAETEVLASHLYKAAGGHAPDMQLIDLGSSYHGGIGVASRMLDSISPFKTGDKDLVKAVHQDFAADAWLANHDVIGLHADNVVFGKAGEPIRIDPGGSMEFRATGGPKAFGPKADEWESMRDLNGKAKEAAPIFSQMTASDLVASAQKVTAIDDATIVSLVNKYGPGDDAKKAQLADTLIKRRDDIAARAEKLLPSPAINADATSPAAVGQAGQVAGHAAHAGETAPAVLPVSHPPSFSLAGLNEDADLLQGYLDDGNFADAKHLAASYGKNLTTYGGGSEIQTFHDWANAAIANAEAKKAAAGPLHQPGFTGKNKGMLAIKAAAIIENINQGDHEHAKYGLNVSPAFLDTLSAHDKGVWQDFKAKAEAKMAGGVGDTQPQHVVAKPPSPKRIVDGLPLEDGKLSAEGVFKDNTLNLDANAINYMLGVGLANGSLYEAKEHAAQYVTLNGKHAEAELFKAWADKAVAVAENQLEALKPGPVNLPPSAPAMTAPHVASGNAHQAVGMPAFPNPASAEFYTQKASGVLDKINAGDFDGALTDLGYTPKSPSAQNSPNYKAFQSWAGQAVAHIADKKVQAAQAATVGTVTPPPAMPKKPAIKSTPANPNTKYIQQTDALEHIAKQVEAGTLGHAEAVAAIQAMNIKWDSQQTYAKPVAAYGKDILAALSGTANSAEAKAATPQAKAQAHAAAKATAAAATAAAVAAKPVVTPAQIKAAVRPPIESGLDFNNMEKPGGSKGPVSSKQWKNDANNATLELIHQAALTGSLDALRQLEVDVLDDKTGQPTGQKIKVAEHPSGYIKGYYAEAYGKLDGLLNPPKPVEHYNGTVKALADSAAVHKGTLPEAKAAGYKTVGRFVVLENPNHPDGKFGLIDPKDIAPKKHVDQAIDHKALAEGAKAQWANWSETEKKAIKSYTGSGYGEMNSNYWNGTKGNKEKALDKAMKEKSHEIPAGTVLGRRFTLKDSSGANVDQKGISDLLAGKAIGKVFQDEGAISTSTNPHFWSGEIHMKIHVSPGVKGMWVSGGHGMDVISSVGAGEREVLLPPKTRFLVIGFRKTEPGKPPIDPDGFGQKHGNDKYLMEVIALPPEE